MPVYSKGEPLQLFHQDPSLLLKYRDQVLKILGRLVKLRHEDSEDTGE